MEKYESAAEINFPKYELHLTSEDLDAVFNDPDHDPNEVMKLFFQDFEDVYRATTGTVESYSLGRHTRMVLDQYFKYFKEKGLPVVSDKFFESLLALHDIGKPYAAIEQDLEKQYEHTVRILNDVMPELGFSEDELRLAIALVDGDPIRKYFYKRRETTAEEVALDIKDRAEQAGLEIGDFWTLMKTYWMADAGSYTEDAGGNPSLDRMFEFEPDDGVMNLAPHIEERFEELEAKIFDGKGTEIDTE